MTGLWRRLFGRPAPAPLDPHRPDLVVVASGFDDAEACSTALARSPEFRSGEPVVLRHHLRVPAEHVDTVCAVAAQDGYLPLTEPPLTEPGSEDAAVATPRPLVLWRVQLLDALHCSQERSRMAGLAQRHDGSVDGWDALQPGAVDGAAR